MNKQGCFVHWYWHIGLVTILAIVAFGMIGCGATYTGSEEPIQVDTERPEVTYNFDSDEALIKANEKARDYCNQYSATANLSGPITQNPDGTKSVTFDCIKTIEATTPPNAPPMSYSYQTDAELLQAMKSADSYCARSGKVASTNIVTNPDGSKTLTYQCVPR